MKAYEPIKDNDSIYGWVCGYCTYPIAFSQKYCEECGCKVKWNDFENDVGGSMDDLMQRIKDLLDEMRKDGTTEIEVDFHDLSRMYQMLNMMKRIAEIADWCKEGYK